MFLFLILGLLNHSLANPCSPALKPGTYTLQIDTKYKRQPAHLYVPSNYNCSKPVPLVVSLHGYGGRGDSTASYLGLKSNYQKYGYALLVPEGTVDSSGKQFWDVGGYCCGKKNGINDAGYLLQLVSTVRNYVNVNSGMISFIGHSNGGFMTYRMACEPSNPASRIATVAGSMPRSTTMCTPSHPVSLLQIHGTKDDIIPYYGSSDQAGAYDSAAYWAKVGRCSSQSTSGAFLDLSAFPGLETTPITWPKCTSPLHVDLWKMEGEGHGPSFNSAALQKISTYLAK